MLKYLKFPNLLPDSKLKSLKKNIAGNATSALIYEGLNKFVIYFLKFDKCSLGTPCVGSRMLRQFIIIVRFIFHNFSLQGFLAAMKAPVF
jgi:hypothetical protein